MNETTFELKPGMRIHLVGIGGAGMSAIARVLLGQGYNVTGSDNEQNELTAALESQGATVYQGHRAGNLGQAEALVMSSAIPESNPELAAARATGVPVLKRADLLGLLMKGKTGIAVAGTHGKTTTTGMITHILMEASLDPTVVVGGVLAAIGSNGRYGAGEHFVVEADEYDHMFLGLRPRITVMTNLEHDHPDVFPTEADYNNAFAQFAALLPAGGHLVVCLDDPGAAGLLGQLDLPGVTLSTYGVVEEDVPPTNADYQAVDCRSNPIGGTDFLVQRSGQTVGLARLRVPGIHNVRNAMAAIVVALDVGVEFNVIRRALAEFGGVGRRFQVVGEVSGVTVIDDYAHHPTEIQATLKAAKQRYPGRRLWAVWQPHTFSRTKLLLDQFAVSFVDADRVVALDIYRSREQDSLGISTETVLAAMNHPKAVHVPELAAAADYIVDRLLPDDVVLTLSAGDGNVVGERVLDALKKREEKE